MGYKLQFKGFGLRHKKRYDCSRTVKKNASEIIQKAGGEGLPAMDTEKIGPLKHDRDLTGMNKPHGSNTLPPYNFENYRSLPDEVPSLNSLSSTISLASSEASLDNIDYNESPDEPCPKGKPEGSLKLVEQFVKKEEPMVKDKDATSSFQCFRLHYLVVMLVVMLSDGLQGTHLYVLYEGYGFSVASLYSLGFITGGLTSPIMGPLVDKFGRKKSALIYCVLEISINKLEQYPVLAGLIVSRMIGGITTNLLSTVFDAWLDTEYRRHGFDKDKYEIIMRDSVIVSNLAAIGSGYLAHVLAKNYGPAGPFEGAVAFTTIALGVIATVWNENYGCCEHGTKGILELLNDAINTMNSDKKVLKVGVIQGLTCASIQIFIFLWSPALRHFAKTAPRGALGLDSNGEPAYGLIFGAFMAAGVLGGLTAPWIRQFITGFLSASGSKANKPMGNRESRPAMAVEFLAAACYLASALLLLVPCFISANGPNSFSFCLAAFLVYEYLVGLYLPCEGVIRSIYFPSEGRASMMTLPRVIVNGAVSLGVVTTNFITMRSAFNSIFALLAVSAFLQISLISQGQWSKVVQEWQRKVEQYSFGSRALKKVCWKKKVPKSL